LRAELQRDGTDTYRLFDSHHDGIDGWVVEVFGRTGIFQWHEGKCRLAPADLQAAGVWLLQHAGLEQIYLKRFVADRSSEVLEEALRNSQPLVGSPSAPCIEALENGRRFEIRPYDGFSVGLFLDQRANRQALALRGAQRVLNLFSYTCAFSVYCATQGAHTTSVDVSARYLEWGKRNFALNGLDLGSHRFFATDARVFLTAAAKREETYDLVFVDPPSFARGKKGRPFSVKKDLAELLGQVRAVVRAGSAVYVSTNYSQWSQADLDAAVGEGLGKAEAVSLPALPSDFAGTPITGRLVRLLPAR